MTSTSVLGSLNSQAVNLMNLTQPTSKNMGADFKDIMNQTGSKGPKLEVKSPSDTKSLKNLKNDSKPADEKPVVSKEVTKSDGTETKVSPSKD